MTEVESTASVTPDADLQAELARVRAQRDALAAKLDRRAVRARQGGRLRQAFVGLLVALSIVLIPLTAAVTWAHQTVFNTDRYVSTVGPLAKDPAVVRAVSAKITDEVYAAVDPQQKIAGALQQIPNVPPKITTALAGPIANGMKGFLTDAVNKALSTTQFQTFWVNANRTAQQQIVAVLHGESTTIQTVNGQVVLNLVPLLNAALQQVQDQLSSLLGKTITLPTLSGNELPSAVCEKISAALGRPVPVTCGQIPLFPASQLTTAQEAVGRFDRWFVGLLILTPLLILAAVWLSKRHRRTALQLAVGGLLGLVVIRRLTMYLQDRIEGQAKPENKAAADAIVSQVLHGFYTLTLTLGIIAVVVAVLLLVTGPYRWARTTRSGVRRGAVAVGTTTASVTRSLAGHAQQETTTTWICTHRGALQLGGVAVAVVLLWLVDLSPLSLLIIGVLLAGYLFGLARIGPADQPPHDPEAPPAARDEPPLPTVRPPAPRQAEYNTTPTAGDR